MKIEVKGRLMEGKEELDAWDEFWNSGKVCWRKGMNEYRGGKWRKTGSKG